MLLSIAILPFKLAPIFPSFQPPPMFLPSLPLSFKPSAVYLGYAEAVEEGVFEIALVEVAVGGDLAAGAVCFVVEPGGF